MNPIIFLSVDNVLNTQQGVEYWLKVKNETYDNYGALFCPKAVEALGKICTQYQADVVVYDEWRKSMELDEMRKMFKERNIKINILDYTPFLPNKNPGIEIQKWFTVNGQPSQFLIICGDDESDEEEFFPGHSINVSPIDGIADKRSYRKAMSIMKKIEKPVPAKKTTKSNPIF